MPRKKWTQKTGTGADLLLFRAKKRWQIALRRYLLEKIPSFEYAPYFGLDILRFRKWIELQFHGEHNWENFSTSWQFDHIVPVSLFDFEKESDLKLCWNFINIRVITLEVPAGLRLKLDLTTARRYFEIFYLKTNFSIALQMVERIDRIQRPIIHSTHGQDEFIKANREYFRRIASFNAHEFDQLNYGVPLQEILDHHESYTK